MTSRRAFMLATACARITPDTCGRRIPVVSPRPLVFPRDHGAHPEYRTEWWYLTGWLDRPGTARSVGFQVTFFRTRTPIDPRNPSAFAAKQLMIAHAAIADPTHGSLLHDQRLARTGFGAASFSTNDTALLLDRWQLMRSPQGGYRGVIPLVASHWNLKRGQRSRAAAR